MQVESEGHGDTWAFVVLGEQYLDSCSSKINVLGWTAQPVLYDPEAPHHIGSHVVGSETAEREGMFWSGMWRLAQDSLIPTTFCTDSRTSARQSSGLDGSHRVDSSYCHLRAAFQCLEATLKEDLDIRHVRGHSDDPWNDFVDAVAKQERTKSFYLPRQQLDMSHWSASLKHLWAALSNTSGLPPFQGDCFELVPPELPPEQAKPVTQQSVTRLVQYHVSLASANVNSLHTSPNGLQWQAPVHS